MPNKKKKLSFAITSVAASALCFSAFSFADITIPIHYIVAASDNDGTEAQASLSDLQDGLNQLNTGYAPIDVNFVIENITYVTSEDVPGINDGDWNTDDEEDARPFFIYGNLNIIVADLDGSNGHAYRHEEATDTIEVEPENLATTTIIHEFGHNVSLRHTFSGVDDAPIREQEGVLGWRYGDGLIDTPVDPGSRSNYSECIYQADDTDSEGTAFNPDGFNYMGRGQNVCRSRYSPQQFRRIAKILATDKFHLHDKYGEGNNPTCANSSLVTQFPHRDGLNYNDELAPNIWTQDAFNDNFNWAFDFDTDSSSTGANGPVEGHSFIHIDSGNSLLLPNDKVNLLSPCYDFTSQPTAYAEFFYLMYGDDIGSLAFEITTDNGESWQQLWLREGEQHTSGVSWSKAVVDLSDFVLTPFQLRLSGEVNDGSRGDVSIDTITVSVDAPSPEQPFGTDEDLIIRELRIATGSDDAEEEAETNEVNIDSSDLELVDEGGTDEQIVGIRYAQANIPQGALISDARIQFMADDDNSGQTDITVRGHLSANSETFTESDGDISQRITTRSSTDWSIQPWIDSGDAGPEQLTPSLTSIVQELVNQDSWTTDSAITFIITGNGEREAESFEGGSTRAARLIIRYTQATNVLGDWDGDGDVDINDIRALNLALSRREDIDASFDINGDGSVNRLDARALFRLCTRENCAA
jgi:hypothetical protein